MRAANGPETKPPVVGLSGKARGPWNEAEREVLAMGRMRGMSSSLSLAARAGLLALIAGSAAACDRGDAASQAVREARQEFAAITGGVSASVDPNAEARFRAIADLLQGVEGDESSEAAAAVLEARALLGLAQFRGVEHEQAEADLRNILTAARGHVRGWSRASARAESAATFDPSDELDALGNDIARLESELAMSRQAAEALADELAAVDLQAETVRNQARTLRTQAAETRFQMSSVSATEGVTLAQRARTISRQADALDVEAGGFEATASVLRPRLAEANLDVQRLENQLRLIGDSRQRLIERADEAQIESDAARAEAGEHASQLEQVLASAADLSESTVTQAFDAAERNIRNAVSSAGRARSADRANASLALARAQRALGDLNWTRARGFSALAAGYEDAASVEPALSQRADYAQRAAQAREAEAAALATAGDAYQAASNAYDGTAARGDDAAAIERIQNALAMLAEGTRGAEMDVNALGQPITPAADPNAFDAGNNFGSEFGSDADAIRAKIQRLVDAATNAQPVDLATLVFTGDPRLDAMMTDLNTVLAANVAYDAAFADRFGMTTAEFTAQDDTAAAATAGLDLAALQDFNASDLTITTEGDVGTMTIPVAQMGLGEADFTMPLINDAGEWKADVSGFLMAIPVDQILMASPVVGQITTVINEERAAVEAGNYDDPRIAMNSLQLRIQPIVFQAMGTIMQPGDG